MEVEDELLDIFQTFSSDPVEHDASLEATSNDSLVKEVYDALRSAEVALLKAELDKLIAAEAKVKSTSGSDSGDQVPHDMSQQRNAQSPGTDLDASPSPPFSTGVTSSHSTSHTVQGPSAVMNDLVQAADDITAIFRVPEGLARRTYAYTGCPNRSRQVRSLGVKHPEAAAVVYWCAPGVARVRGNAALGLAMQCAQSLQLPLIAVAVEDSSVYGTAKGFQRNNFQDQDGKYLIGRHRKHMFRLSCLCAVEAACTEVGVPMLACSLNRNEHDVGDIFDLIRRECGNDQGEILIFTDFVGHCKHQEECAAVAQHNTTLTPSSMAAEPTANAAHDREYDLWTPLEKNGILLIAVEHGCVLSLLSLHCTGHVSTIDNSAPRPSKRPRKEYCQLKHDNPTLTLNEFAQLYLKASETIIGEALNMQYIVDCPASIRHSNDAGYKLCEKCGNGDTMFDINDTGIVLSVMAWAQLREIAKQYRLVAKQALARLRIIPSSFGVWGFPAELASRIVYSELLTMEKSPMSMDADSDFPLVQMCKLAVSYYCYRDDAVTMVKVDAIKSLIDLTTVGGVFSQREILRELFAAGSRFTKNVQNGREKLGRGVWHRCLFEFMLAEYYQYLVMKLTWACAASGKDSSESENYVSPLATDVINGLIQGIRHRDGNLHVAFPTEVFSAATRDPIFNAIEAALSSASIIPSMHLGGYWMTYLLLNLPTPEMGFRACISELATYSLYDEGSCACFAMVMLGAMVEVGNVIGIFSLNPTDLHPDSLLEQIASDFKRATALSDLSFSEWCSIFSVPSQNTNSFLI